MKRGVTHRCLTAAALACGLCATPLPAVADEAAMLGRIFLTPEQRRLLDQRRADPGESRGPDLPADLLPARLGPPRRVVLNGVVKRGEEPPLLWINGQRAAQGAEPAQGVRVRGGPDGQDRVALEAGRMGAVAHLKPGQAWDLASGQVSDCLQCGQPAPRGPAPDVPASGDAPP